MLINIPLRLFHLFVFSEFALINIHVKLIQMFEDAYDFNFTQRFITLSDIFSEEVVH